MLLLSNEEEDVNNDCDLILFNAFLITNFLSLIINAITLRTFNCILIISIELLSNKLKS